MKKLHFPKPKPLKEELELEDVDKHRKLDCIFYDSCLDYASDFIYNSFSCNGCAYYYKNNMSGKERKAFEEIAKVIIKKEINDEKEMEFESRIFKKIS
jgi:hypothetical protein